MVLDQIVGYFWQCSECRKTFLITSADTSYEGSDKFKCPDCKDGGNNGLEG